MLHPDPGDGVRPRSHWGKVQLLCALVSSSVKWEGCVVLTEALNTCLMLSKCHHNAEANVVGGYKGLN